MHKISWEKKSNLIGGKYREASGEHRGTVQNPGNLKCRPWMLSGWTLSEDPDMSDRRSWNVLLSHPAVRYPNVKCRRIEFRMWNVGARNSSPGGLSYAAQEGLSTCARCRDPSPGWHGVRKAIRINSIRISQEDTRRAPLSGFPLVEAHNTREHHTSDDSISYMDMLSGSLTNVSKPCYSSRSVALRWCVRTSFAPCIPNLLMAKDFKALFLHVSELSIALPWIPKNSP